MHTVKSASATKFNASKYEPQSAKAFSSKTFDLDNLSTEGQQERIKKLVDSRKTGLLGTSSIVISQSDLMRMKNSSLIITKEEIMAQRKMKEEMAEQKMAAAKAKKQKMAEIEAERKKDVPLTESEMETMEKNEHIQARAKQLMNEGRDEVKSMNQMMLYAKVVTVRDQQLAERREIENYRKREEKMKDLLMEVDRLKKIKHYEGIENGKKEDMRKAAMETITQIKEREWERVKAQDEREKEGQEMLRHIKQMQKEENEVNLAKKQKQKHVLEQIFESNNMAIQKKHEKILHEKEEDDKINQYNIEKMRKDAEYQAELKRIKEQKEREIQKLRELQEKASDRQSEIDALRAKRASDLADRLAREKDRKEAELRANKNHDLLEARKLQSLEKDRRLQEQAIQEKEEFQRILEAQRANRDMELMSDEEKRLKLKDHSNQLKKQIVLHEEKEKQAKREYLEQGKLIKDQLRNEKQLLETIKMNKIEELNELGVNPKYQAELTKKRIII